MTGTSSVPIGFLTDLAEKVAQMARDIPGISPELAEAYGNKVAMQMATVWGGLAIYMPKVLHLQEGHPTRAQRIASGEFLNTLAEHVAQSAMETLKVTPQLAEKVGVTVAILMQAEWAGLVFYLPKALQRPKEAL